MSIDVVQALKREADDIQAQSRTEEGTLAAYLRGYAAGLIAGAKRVQQDQNYRDIVAQVLKPTEYREYQPTFKDGSELK